MKSLSDFISGGTKKVEEKQDAAQVTVVKTETREYQESGSCMLVEVEILSDGTERVVRRGRFL